MTLVNDNVEDWSCTTSSLLGSGLMGGNCSDSDSSIGKDSDATGEEDSGDSTMEEVESPYKGGLDLMEASPMVLPLGKMIKRRGISAFYRGKSKSFASLARASSIQDLAKPEIAYTRRLRNRSRACSSLRSNGGGISKKTFSNMGGTNLALAIAITAASSETDNINTATCHGSELEINVVLPTFSPFQKPKHRVSGLSCIQHVMSKWRSFSLADLQYTSTGTSIEIPTTQCSRFGSTSSDETQCPF